MTIVTVNDLDYISKERKIISEGMLANKEDEQLSNCSSGLILFNNVSTISWLNLKVI
ncbi:hypothetical protein [Staphylococcus epidermidis]|uniref:hypothetical protein n=1 Tax=Staphylococcus epidermidis TaxID=1282 RepID=UPI001981B611|nr:hypothetical protein [Staphylococcus epidermidis]